MTAQQIVLSLTIFFHDIFTVLWIGGMFTLGIIVLPSVRSALTAEGEIKKLVKAMQTRLESFAAVSMVGLILTGMLLARRNVNFDGLLALSNAFSLTLAIKHVLVLMMVAISLYRSVLLGKRKQPLSAKQEKLKLRLLFFNILLGAAVLFATAVNAAV